MLRKIYASKHFVPRDDLIDEFEQALARSGQGAPMGLLFHGEAGSGKTWLYHHLVETLRARIKRTRQELSNEQTTPGHTLLHLTLDKQESDPWNWFMDLRDSTDLNLAVRPRLRIAQSLDQFSFFQRFDLTSGHYAKRILEAEDYVNPKLKVNKLLSSGAAEAAIDPAVKLVTERAPFALVRDMLKHGSDWLINRIDKRAFGDELDGIEYWSIDEYQDRFASFLARDINDLCERYPNNKLVILIDSHDRVLAARSIDEARHLERFLRVFCDSLTGGLVCLFSQYQVSWFVDAASGAPDAATDDPAVASAESGDAYWQLLREAGLTPEIDPPDVVTRPRAARINKRVRVEEFSPAMTRDFLTRRGLAAELDTSLGQAIITTTRLTFEIEEKATWLVEALLDPSSMADRDALARTLALPFDEFFREGLDAKPDAEVRLLRHLWRVGWFTRSLATAIGEAFGHPVNSDVLDRTLGHGMVDELPRLAEGGQRYRIDPHYLPHLQLDHLRQMQARFGAPRRLGTAEPLKVLRHHLWRHGNKASPHMTLLIGGAFGDEAARQFCTDMRQLARPLHDAGISGGAWTGDEALHLAEQAFAMLMACLVMPGTTNGPPRLLGDWPTRLVAGVLERALDGMASLSGERSYEDIGRQLEDLEGKALCFVEHRDADEEHRLAFLTAGARAVEARAGLAARWRGDADQAVIRDRLGAWIDALARAGGSFVRHSRYWGARLECQYHVIQPHRRHRTNSRNLSIRPQAYQFGASKTRFLRAFDDFQGLLRNAPPEVAETGHHKRAMLSFLFHEAQVRPVRAAQTSGLWTRAITQAQALLDEYPDDVEISVLLASIYLQQPRRRLTFKGVSEKRDTLLRLHRHTGGRLDVLSALEKAFMTYARLLRADAGGADAKDGEAALNGGADAVSADGEATSVAEVRTAVEAIQVMLRREVERSATPSLELCKLVLKNIRKSVSLGVLPSDLDRTQHFLNALFARLADLDPSVIDGFHHEAASAAELSPELAPLIHAEARKALNWVVRNAEAASANAGARVRLALWACFVAEVARIAAQDEKGPSRSQIDDIMAALAAVDRAVEALVDGTPLALEAGERLRTLRLNFLKRVFHLYAREVTAGADRWREVIGTFERSRNEEVQPLDLLKSLCLLAVSAVEDGRDVPSADLATIEAAALEALPLDLGWYAAVVRARNRCDTSLSKVEQERRERVIAAIASAASPPGPGEEADGTERGPDTVYHRDEKARDVARSALAYVLVKDGEDTPDGQDAIRRVLAEAVIACDPILAADDPAKVRLRTAYGRAVWLALHATIDRNRGRQTAHLSLPDTAFAAFATGSHEKFFDDLMALLDGFPLPMKLGAKDLIVGTINAVTVARVNNGAMAEPGPALLGHRDHRRIVLPSNLTSIRHFHELLRPDPSMDHTQQHDELPEGEIDEPRGVEGAEVATAVARAEPDAVSLFEALSGPRRLLAEPQCCWLAIRHVEGEDLHVTERGHEFVAEVFNLLFPGELPLGGLSAEPGARQRLAIGGSNAKLALFVSSTAKSALLRGDGWFAQALKDLFGVRAFTLMACARKMDAGGVERELREFSACNFRNIELVEFNGAMVRYVAPNASIQDLRKLRTFEALAVKLFPGLSFSISAEEGWWQERSGDERAAQFEKHIGRRGRDDTVVDLLSDLDEEQRLEVVGVHFDRESGGVRRVMLADGDGTAAVMEGSVANRLGVYFVEGQGILCRLRRGAQGIFYVSTARLHHPPEGQLVQVEVTQIQGSSFVGEAPKVGAGHPISGRTGLAKRAGHDPLKVGDVLCCEVGIVKGEHVIVYVKGSPPPGATPRAMRGSIANFSRKLDAYFMAADDEGVRIMLPRHTVERAGYAALTPGDEVQVEVISQKRGLLARRVLTCDRVIVREVRGVLGVPERGRDRWPVRVEQPSRLGLTSSPPTIFVERVALEVDTSLLRALQGARIVLDVQKDDALGWRAAHNARLDLVNGGNWVLAPVKLAARRERNALVLDMAGEEGDAPIPACLHRLLPSAETGLWLEAKVCRTGDAAQSGLVVCAVRRPRRDRRQLRLGRIVGANGEQSGVKVEVEGMGQTFLVAFATLRRAGLPFAPLHLAGAPILCRLDTIGTEIHITDLEFDPSRGWSDVLCHLHPFKAESRSRTLVTSELGRRFVVRSGEPLYATLKLEKIGTILAATGFDDESGRPKLVEVRVEVNRIPWRYGFVEVASARHVRVRLFGGEICDIPYHIIGNRGLSPPGRGKLIRLTEIPTEEAGFPLGMFEVQDPAAPWNFTGCIEWYDADKDFGKIGLVDDESVDLRLQMSSVQTNGGGWVKGLPVRVQLDKIVMRETRSGELKARGYASSVLLVDIFNSPWHRAVVAQTFPSGSAILDLAEEQNGRRQAYAGPHVVANSVGNALIAVGEEVLCQTVAGLEHRLTVANLVRPQRDELGRDLRVAICDGLNADWRTADFMLVETGAHLHASPRVFAGETCYFVADDIVLVQVEELAGESIVTAVLGRLGRRIRHPHAAIG